MHGKLLAFLWCQLHCFRTQSILADGVCAGRKYF
ncbi:DUF3927 domain-containing protein [Roseburia sp. AM59-24XD]|nr:DUF3927 domain-containing protein [Roseburia sp. AM59-24XD]